MKKKLLSFLALFISLSIYFSCTDEGVEVSGLQRINPDSDLLAYAMNLVGENGEGCSLIDFQKGNSNSRAVTDYSTVATPLWDKAKTEHHGDEEVLIVPLQGEDDIHSSMYFEEEDMGRLYQTKTFSKLVIRSKNGVNTPQILTYLPGRNYAKNRQAVLDTMGFSPLDVKYYGTILVSNLDGEFLQGFFYERGVPILHIKPQKHSHTDVYRSINDTTECDSIEDLHPINLRLKLSGSMIVSSRSYEEEDETEYVRCKNCQQAFAKCSCETPEIVYVVCDSCNFIKINCVCPEKCTFCGQRKCICATRCVRCKKDPCICTPKRCEHCLEFYCDGKCKEPKPEKPNEEPNEKPNEEPEVEIAPEAKKIFYNSNMTRQDWLLLENMIVEIMDDCLGGELCRVLENADIPIQLTDNSYIGFSSFDSFSGITLSRNAQSFHLLREMLHAYRARTLSPELYNSTRLNGEIEALYVQYLYMSKLSTFRNSKWEKLYCSGMVLEAVKKLENVLDNKGELKSGKNNADLTAAVNLIATYLQKSPVYNSYSFNSSRTGLENFSILNTLTIGCQ